MSKNSLVDIEEQLRLSGKKIRMVGYYKNAKTKTTFECGRGHHFEAIPNNIRQGSGCKLCKKGGGFDTSKPAWTYVLQFNDFIKFDITNNIKNRLYSHKKNEKYSLVYSKYYLNGQQALDWENNIKHKYGGNFVTKVKCPDGYTETLPVELLEAVIFNK